MSASVLKQINVRIPPDLHEALADHKERTGEDKSDVVRRGIELALGVEPSQPGPDLNGAPPAPSAAAEPPAAAAGATAASPPVEPEHREGSGSGDSTSDSPPSDEASVDLVEWLAERTDLPRALLRARIGNGRVSVAGRTWHDLEIPQILLDQVELDGTAPAS